MEIFRSLCSQTTPWYKIQWHPPRPHKLLVFRRMEVAVKNGTRQEIENVYNRFRKTLSPKAATHKTRALWKYQLLRIVCHGEPSQRKRRSRLTITSTPYCLLSSWCVNNGFQEEKKTWQSIVILMILVKFLIQLFKVQLKGWVVPWIPAGTP
jgi:hypothetical protein